MNRFHRLTIGLLPLAISLLASGQPTFAAQSPQNAAPPKMETSPLIDKVRAATARFKDINVALREGWAVATPCVSGPDTGAMGVHLVMGSRLADGIISADEPEALIYEPLPGGAMRLVGVEFIEIAGDWTARHPNGPPPALDGNLMNLIGAPNRYGLPALWELHVWAWEDNPKGNFADWNTHVSCEQQALE
jgi:hypothetical protein